MAAPNVCPKCGFPNQPGWTFCTNCGNPVPPSAGGWTAPAPVPGQVPAATYPAYPGYASPVYGPPPWEAERRKQIRRTKTGVLLLLVGSLIDWIPLPLIGVLGSLCIFIGVILVILGRKAFGAEHRRNIVISILLYVVGIIVIVVAVVVVVFSGTAGVPQGASRQQIASALQSAITNSLYIVVAGGIIVGLAGVLFTYALQKTPGRILLWAAYGATIGILTALAILAFPFVPGVADDLAGQIVAGNVSRLDTTRLSQLLGGQTTGTALLNVVPSLLYAAAAYLAWDRINKGEIPAQPMPPGVPGAMPPAGPPPPISPI